MLPINFYYDEIVVRYIPFLNIIKIDTYGNNVKITTAENEESIIYSPDHHITAWVRGALFNGSPDYLKISVTQNKTSFYSSNIAEKLLESNGDNIVITNTKTTDNLNLLTLEGKSNISFLSENYSKNFSDKILKFLRNKIREDINLNSFEYDVAKLDILNLPTSYNSKLKLKYSDELVALGKLLIQNFSLDQKQDENMNAVIFMQILGELVKGKPFLFACDIEKKEK